MATQLVNLTDVTLFIGGLHWTSIYDKHSWARLAAFSILNLFNSTWKDFIRSSPKLSSGFAWFNHSTNANFCWISLHHPSDFLAKDLGLVRMSDWTDSFFHGLIGWTWSWSNLALTRSHKFRALGPKWPILSPFMTPHKPHFLHWFEKKNPFVAFE